MVSVSEDTETGIRRFKCPGDVIFSGERFGLRYVGDTGIPVAHTYEDARRRYVGGSKFVFLSSESLDGIYRCFSLDSQCRRSGSPIIRRAEASRTTAPAKDGYGIVESACKEIAGSKYLD